MVKVQKYLLINATAAFVCAFLLTACIHEFGHFMVFYHFNAGPILFHNYVQANTDTLGITAQVLAKLAGPLISLAQGIIAWLWLRKSQHANALNLLVLWLSLLGFVNFFGYLMMTPFSGVGDTGQVAKLLQLSLNYRLAIALTSLPVLIILVLRVGKIFSRFIPEQQDLTRRKRYVYQLMFLPIILGSIVNTLLTFPAPALLSIIYPATSSFVIMSAFRIILKSPIAGTNASKLEQQLSPAILACTVVWVMINRLLTSGLG